jgi:single-stranded-DNA-specific exonuclease
VFDGEFAVLEQRPVAKKHLRLTLLAAGRRREAMLFNDSGPLPERIRAAYRLEVNHYQGLASLQLVLEGWQRA